MSILVIQVGQCGNQIGHELFSIYANCAIGNLNSLNSNYLNFSEDIISRFFTESSLTCSERSFTANAILVDTENKVIDSISKKRKSNWSYPKQISSSSKPTQGSGNNWAYGNKVHGPKQESNILESIRCVVERCDSLSGFLVLQSLAGGTGSGLGTYITELLRRDYPYCFIINQVIWPFIGGEVSVQNYNGVLALSHLHATSDLIVSQRNDSVAELCQRHLGQDTVGFRELNDVIAGHLAAILSPMTCGRLQSSNSLGDLIGASGGDVCHKLYDILATPYTSQRARSFSNHSWLSIIKNIGPLLHESSRLYLHGVDLPSADLLKEYGLGGGTEVGSKKSLRLFQRKCVGLSNYDRRATALVKGDLGILNNTIARGWPLFTRRAFLQQYERYGVTTSDFLDAFTSCEQIVCDYNK